MTHEELYKLHCEDKFRILANGQQKILDCLNGEDGLKMRVDRNTRWIKNTTWMLRAVYGATIGLVVWWIKSRLSA